MTSQPKTKSSCKKASVWKNLGKCKVLKKVPGKEDRLLWVRASSHKQNMERHENLVHNKMQTEKALRRKGSPLACHEAEVHTGEWESCKRQKAF